MTDAEHEAPPDARPDPDRGNDDAPGPTELPIVRTRWEVIPPFRTLAVEDTITAWGFTGDDFVTGRQSWLDRIHPDDYRQEVAHLMQDIDAAQSQPVSYTTYRFQLADGRWQRLASINVFEFDRTGRAVVASTLLNPDPRAVSAVLAMRADDGQRRADSDRLAAILRFASDPIVLTDAFGRPTWANGAFGRLGLTFEDLQQRLMCDALVANAVNAGTLEGLGTALATGQPYRGDLQFVLDPHPVLMEVDCVPLRVPEGRVSGFMMTLRDVTATRAAAATLAEREAQVRDVERLEAMGRLAAGVAHDFGNLLQLIGGSLEMLDRGLHTDDPLRRHASTARGAVERAADLTRQLLLFGKPSRAVPRLVDARLVVRRLEPMLRRLLREDILLHVTMPPYPLWLRIEAAEFERVLVNLILNARDAIAGAGDIWLSLARVVLADRVAAERDVAPGAYAEVLVQDTGAGMPSDALARAFEPFFSTKGAAGTGLGLSTVYGIARHGGGYAVARAGRGASPDDRGMTFRVGLPEATSVDDDAPEEAPPRAWMGPAMTGDVLIAEDDAAVAGLLADALRAAGHRVRVAGDGTAAKRWLHDASVPVDLLLTDVVMPGDSGPMLVHEARRARPGLPVLFISGYPDDELARHREMYAEVPLLRKPFAVDDLLAAVQEQLLPRR